MHNVNLGLLFTANGSALLSGLKVQYFHYVDVVVSWEMKTVSIRVPGGKELRYALAKAGWYGNPQRELGSLFNSAHTDFKAWCKERKIYSYQRNFRYGLEPLL